MCNFRCALREDNIAILRQNSLQLGWNQNGRRITYYHHDNLVLNDNQCVSMYIKLSSEGYT